MLAMSPMKGRTIYKYNLIASIAAACSIIASHSTRLSMRPTLIPLNFSSSASSTMTTTIGKLTQHILSDLNLVPYMVPYINAEQIDVRYLCRLKTLHEILTITTIVVFTLQQQCVYHKSHLHYYIHYILQDMKPGSMMSLGRGESRSFFRRPAPNGNNRPPVRLLCTNLHLHCEVCFCLSKPRERKKGFR